MTIRVVIAVILLSTFSVCACAQTYAPIDADSPPKKPGNGCDGGCPISLEQLMRQFEAINKAMDGPEPHWPRSDKSCSSGGDGTDTPPSPPDGFYGNSMCDPRRAADLVRRTIDAMKEAGGGWIDDFIRDNIEADSLQTGGSAPESLDTWPNWDALFDAYHAPRSGDVTDQNYCEALRAISNALASLMHTQIKGDKSTFLGGFREEFGEFDRGAVGGHPECFEGPSYSAALARLQDQSGIYQQNYHVDGIITTGNGGGFQAGKYINIVLPGPIPPPPNREVEGCGIGYYDGTYYTYQGSGYLHTLLPKGRGSVSDYLELEYQGPRGINIPNDPSIPPSYEGSVNDQTHGDGARQYGEAPAPASWSRRVGQSPLEVEFLGHIVNFQDTLIKHRWSLFTPQTVEAKNTASFPGVTGCQSCGPGQVTYSQTNLDVRISLGSTDHGSAGYLLIHGDTIIGTGNEMFEFRTGLPPTVGPGATELDSPRIVKAISDELQEGPEGGYDWFGNDAAVIYPENMQLPGEIGKYYLQSLHVPQAQVRIIPNGAGCTIEIWRHPVWDNGHYSLDGAELVKSLTLSHHMEPLQDNPASEDPRDVIVSGTFDITDSSSGLITRYRQSKKVRYWSTLVDDLINFDSRDAQGNKLTFDQIPEGFLPSPEGPSRWYDPDASAGDWAMQVIVAATGQIAEHGSTEWSRGKDATSGDLVEDRRVLNQIGGVTRRIKRITRTSSAGLPTVTEIEDPDSTEQTTIWTYDGSGSGLGRLLSVQYPSGYWEAFEYASNDGRLSRTVSQFLGNSFDVTAYAQNRVKEYRMSTNNLRGGTRQDQPRHVGRPDYENILVVRNSLEGHEIGRDITIYWGKPADSQSAWQSKYETTIIKTSEFVDANDNASLLAFLSTCLASPSATTGTFVEHMVEQDTPAEREYGGAYAGYGGRSDHRPVARWSSSGIGEMYAYEFTGGPLVSTCTKLESGVLKHPDDPVPVSSEFQLVDGIRTEDTTDGIFNTVEHKSYDMQGTVGPDLQGDDVLLEYDRATQFEYARPQGDQDLGRVSRMTHIDGTFDDTYYSCCAVSSRLGRDGVRYSYMYDSENRLVEEIAADSSPAAVRSAYKYDSQGRVIETYRGPLGSDQLQSRNYYDVAGRLYKSRDVLGAETSYSHVVERVNNRVIDTTTLPNPDGVDAGPTQIRTTYSDGSVVSASGSANHPQQYSYGVEADASLGSNAYSTWTRESRLDDNGQANEWVKTYRDPLGRVYKTVLADGATSRTYFDGHGRVVKQVDPDGVATLSREGYGHELGLPGTDNEWNGYWSVSAVDVNLNGIIDFGGTDRVTKAQTWVMHDGNSNYRRTRTAELTTNNNGTVWLETSLQDTSIDGLTTTSKSFGQQSTSATVISASQQKTTVTTTNPDLTSAVAISQYGRPISSRTYFNDGSLRTESLSTYDSLGRVWKITDTRATTDTSDDRVVTYTYDGKDRVISIAVSAAIAGQPDIASTTTYDNLDRVLTSTEPDGTVTHFEYFPTGETKKTWGGKAYPVEYTYDSQGRRKTLKTWQVFNLVSGQGTSGAATTTWNYDPARGWLISKSYARPGSSSYEYWPSGRLKRRTWARGISTTYTYNSSGAVQTIDYSDATPDVSYTYDRRGRVIGVTDGVGTRTLAYGDAGQFLDEDFTSGVLDPVHIQNQFDTTLRRTLNHLTVNGVTTNDVGFGYDIHSSRLASVSMNTTRSAQYAYQPGGELVQSLTYKNGSTTMGTVTRSYDRLNRLTQIASDSTAGPDESFTYTYNAGNQRTNVALNDGTYWAYQYDALGQVTNGTRYVDVAPAGPSSSDTPLPGEQFQYTFDAIGNRTQAKSGGNSTGQNLRTSTYAVNLGNQYTSRTVPNGVDILGFAPAGNSVTLATPPGGTSVPADYRYGQFFQKAFSWDNSTSNRFEGVDINTDGQPGPEETRWLYLQRTPETFGYDSDGNLLSDGRWIYTWDGENRLIAMETNNARPATAPPVRLEFVYDYLSRRSVKRRFDQSGGESFTAASSDAPVKMELSGSSSSAAVTSDAGGPAAGPQTSAVSIPIGWNLVSTSKFVWDGWNLIAELDGNDAKVRTCAWGLDLSGTEQGAGGIGGLAFEYLTATNSTHHAYFDGNGNLTSLRDDTGAISAGYEYGPFGETLTIRGSAAALAANAYRFSTKYNDSETGLLYYGFRYYNPGTGRWLNRDPIGESEDLSLYTALHNNTIDHYDFLGLEGEPRRERDRDRRYRPDRPRDRSGNSVVQNLLFDARGSELFYHWLGGSGTIIVRREGEWGSYMRRNSLLSAQLKSWIESDALSREDSGAINSSFHAEIENGYLTGYQMLHGTNANKGDFSLRGSVAIFRSSDCERYVSYNLDYGWHDVIDPNPQYYEDVLYSRILNGLDPKDYDIHIYWHDRCTVHIKDGKIVKEDEGGYPLDR